MLKRSKEFCVIHCMTEINPKQLTSENCTCRSQDHYPQYYPQKKLFWKLVSMDEIAKFYPQQARHISTLMTQPRMLQKMADVFTQNPCPVTMLCMILQYLMAVCFVYPYMTTYTSCLQWNMLLTVLLSHKNNNLQLHSFHVQMTRRLESHPCVITVQEMGAARHFLRTTLADKSQEERLRLLQPTLELNPRSVRLQCYNIIQETQTRSYLWPSSQYLNPFQSKLTSSVKEVSWVLPHLFHFREMPNSPLLGSFNSIDVSIHNSNICMVDVSQSQGNGIWNQHYPIIRKISALNSAQHSFSKR